MLKEPLVKPEIVEEAEDGLGRYSYREIDIENIEDHKEFWQQQWKMLKSYHGVSQSGRGLTQMHSGLVDVLLRYFYQNAKERYEKKWAKEWHPISIIGLGEYGRDELLPYGKVDLMLLYSERIHSDSLATLLEIFNEEIIDRLWELKIRVRHAYRTVNYSIADARRNFEVKCEQLDARFICGSRELFEVFREKYDNFFRNDIGAFYLQCIECKQRRYRRYNFTVFLQEPNVRDGIGGLSDYQTLLWMGRAKLRALTLEAFEHQGIISRSEVIRLEVAHDFLLRVKNELHFQDGKANNLLNIERQSQVAWGLGYRQNEGFARASAFMRDYYEQTQAIHKILEDFEERLRRLEGKRKRKTRFRVLFEGQFGTVVNQLPKKCFDGFTIVNNRLGYGSKMIFIEDPTRLIRAFRYAQQYRVELSYEIKILIRESLNLISDELINDPSSNSCFMSILQAVGEVYPILMLMHELGVLGRFIPEFQRITGLLQYEQYHRYTVDIHTLNTIQVLDEVFRQKDADVNRYYRAIKRTTRPWLLYLILLLHDLGKVNGGNYREMGVQVVKPILERLKIGVMQQEYVLFMIKNDLRMVKFWQNLDIDDPEVPGAFGLLMGGEELLNYFYVQTYCEFMATGSDVWNNHKEMLHTEFYEKILDFFVEYEGYVEEHIKDKKDLYRESIYKYDQDLTQDEVDERLKLYPVHYFVLNSPKEFDLHIRLIMQAKEHIERSSCSGSLMPTIDWEYDINQCVTIATIVTWDRTGFLANVAGALAACGFNILEMKTFLRSDRVNIFVFHIMESKNNNKSNESLRAEFHENLRQILMNDVDLTLRIGVQIKRNRKNTRLTRQGLRLIPKTTPQINVRYELLNRRTIIVVHCADKIGLVYQFSRVISLHGFNIEFLRVSTECGDAVLTFHIHKNNLNEGPKIRELIRLRECLGQIVEMK